MKNKHSSVDGFVTRKPNSKLAPLNKVGRNHNKDSSHPIKNALTSNKSNSKQRHIGKSQRGFNLGSSDIDESLKGLSDDINSTKKMSRKDKKKLKRQRKATKSSRSSKKLITKIILTIIIIGMVSAGAYLGYRTIKAGDNITQGNIFDIFKSQALKKDTNGRSNFLILGTSEDDEGHAGANLTDSMMVVSIDQDNKNAYMFSIPRDLYVEYGEACPAGYSGKINSYFMCANDGDSDDDEQERLAKTQAFVGDIFGIDIQYGIHVNHTVIKEVVDAVGGIDVDIQGSNGDSGILDRNFDWRCNYQCYLVKYDNGVHHLDGEHALFLAMARGDIAPTYGLSNSNFDREVNQQKILVAVRDKALTIGSLTNLGTVTKLIDALGDNLRTNIETGEIQTILSLANDIKSTDIKSISLVDSNEPVMGTGMYYEASVVMPIAGIFNYTEIQSYIAKNLSSDPVVREAASIVVLNATGVTGYAASMKNDLIDRGYNVVLADNAPDGIYDKVEIFQIGDEGDGTAKELANLYGVTIKETTPPIVVGEDIIFVIIFGEADSTNN